MKCDHPLLNCYIIASFGFLPPNQDKLDLILLFYTLFNYCWFQQDDLLMQVWENELCCCVCVKVGLAFSVAALLLRSVCGTYQRLHDYSGVLFLWMDGITSCWLIHEWELFLLQFSGTADNHKTPRMKFAMHLNLDNVYRSAVWLALKQKYECHVELFL